jgi:outer membrane protein OmpA-like peptidoglycan-associated protein/ABC-type nitrate/sulfonate/bicarbonate transport system substrate-binding protein
MQRLTPLAKGMIGAIAVGSLWGAVHTYGPNGARPSEDSLAGERTSSVRAALTPNAHAQSTGQAPTGVPAPGAARSTAKGPAVPPPYTTLDSRPVRVGLSQWPGHLALVVGAGGLTTQPGSVAAQAGLNLEIKFLEDAPTKNKALATGEVDFVWTTVDEMPINLGTFVEADVPVRAFLQIDWSRGGDACVASPEVKQVEDVLGRKSAMLMFSPDHTVFEFMISNSRLSPAQAAEVRNATQFSLDDFTFGRKLFAQGEVDVACLWEPDVTLALAERKGAHRLFSTADATELVADVLLARKDTLDARPDIAQKLARVWFKSVEVAEADRPHAARVITDSCSRFKDELGYEKTLGALSWAKWTTLGDNVRFFGLDGSAPAFDRVYNQADSIWINYPQAEIEHRFPPATLRDDRSARAVWEAAGKPSAAPEGIYDHKLAYRGEALFTKPVSITFGMGSAQLGPTAMALINQEIVPQLEIARGMLIRVEGNTDPSGDPGINQVLSQRRAQAIVDYLVLRGVPKNRVVARGNGSSKPIAPNETAEGRALNRRTDVLFIRGAA